MGDTHTPNYGYTIQTFGLNRDTWGDLDNANWSKLDTDLKAVSDAAGGSSSSLATLIANIRAYIEPIGSIKPWPSPSLPAGWIPCDGGAISRATFSELFGVIGGIWGSGDGSTTFNVPNFVDRVLVHRDNGGIVVGTLGGENAHTLTVAEMPLHGHPGSGTDNQGDHSHSYSAPQVNTPAVQMAPGSGFSVTTTGATTGNAGTHFHNVNVAGQGGGAAHNNMQAFAGVMWIIKAANQL